ncbi:MAG TPA: Trm112 family protein, partial [Albitalea sp.]
CPICKGPLEMRRDADLKPLELTCHADRMAYPIRDGIPVMLEHEARPLDNGNHDATTTAK